MPILLLMMEKFFAYWLTQKLGDIAQTEYNLGNVELARFYLSDAKKVYESCGLTKPGTFEQQMAKIYDLMP